MWYFVCYFFEMEMFHFTRKKAWIFAWEEEKKTQSFNFFDVKEDISLFNKKTHLEQFWTVQ